MPNSHPVKSNSGGGGGGGEVQHYEVLENSVFQPVVQVLLMVHRGLSGGMYSYLGITIFHNHILNMFTVLSTVVNLPK